MRLFIAVPLAEDMKKALVACMHDLKRQGVEGNYVPAQNLHLTLAFIGEYDQHTRSRVEGDFGAGAVSGVSPEPFGKRKFRQHPVGGGQGQPEAEKLRQGAAERSGRRRHSL